MIPIVHILQFLQQFFPATPHALRQLDNRFGKILFQFLLGDAANRLVGGIHADIGSLVEPAEHAHLGKLGHAGQKHELQVGIGHFEYRIERFQHGTVPIFQDMLFSVLHRPDIHVQDIEQRLVVFVHQYHATPAVPMMSLFQHIGEPVSQKRSRRALPIFDFPFSHIIFQSLFQSTGGLKIHPVEIDMKHRIRKPFCLQFLDGQTFKKLLPALEIAFNRGHQQTLAEPPRTAKGVNFSRFDQLEYQSGLVNIDALIFPYLLKCLYSKRVS